MRPPVLDREVTLERLATSGDPIHLAPDSTFGTKRDVWVALSYLPGSPQIAERFPAEIRDVMPSRSESVAQGLVIGRNATRIRLRYRDDIDSSMRVRIHGDGDDEIVKIIGGPAAIGERKTFIEIFCERSSTP